MAEPSALVALTAEILAAACAVCGGTMFADELFNHDMRLLGALRVRLRCQNDHGVVLGGGEAPRREARQRLCLKCARPLTAEPQQSRYHKECYRQNNASHRKMRFKSGFVEV